MQILMLYNVPGECFKLLEAYKGPAAEQVVVPLQVPNTAYLAACVLTAVGAMQLYVPLTCTRGLVWWS